MVTHFMQPDAEASRLAKAPRDLPILPLRNILAYPFTVWAYLKKEPFFSEVSERLEIPDIATGLAVMAVGGDILFIEATRMEGKGNLTLTGHLGDVMRESAQIAYSYVRSKASEGGLTPKCSRRSTCTCTCPRGRFPRMGHQPGSPWWRPWPAC